MDSLIDVIIKQSKNFASEEKSVSELPQYERVVIEKLGGVSAVVKVILKEQYNIRRSEAKLALEEIQAPKSAEYANPFRQRTSVIQERKRKNELLANIIRKLGVVVPMGKVAVVSKIPSVKTASEAWFLERRQDPLTIKRHRISIRRFLEMFGENIRVDEITRKMVEEYVERITKLTDHRLVPISLRGGMHQVGDIRPISAPTVGRHLITIKALLTFCIKKEWVQSNVATTVTGPRDERRRSSRRRSMTREERVLFLNRAIAESGPESDVVWLIKLAAYTGGRLEELAQLDRANVKSVDGIVVVEIDDANGRLIKNEQSNRMIPLHDDIKQDFLDWLQKSSGTPNSKVFQSFRKRDGRYSNTLSGEIARLMDRAGLSDPKLVMHSFRHGMKTALANAGVDGDFRRVILGHRPRDACLSP